MIRKFNRFGRGGGCFDCRMCGKKSRDTGENGSVQLCPLCNVKAMNGNSLSDAGFNRNSKGQDAWQVFDGCKSTDECDALLTEELEKLADAERTNKADIASSKKYGF